MFGGDETDVSMEFHNSLIGVVYDRFGLDVPVLKTDAEHFMCRTKIAVSPQFLSWIMGFGSKAKILSPQKVVDEICGLAEAVRDNYSEK